MLTNKEVTLNSCHKKPMGNVCVDSHSGYIPSQPESSERLTLIHLIKQQLQVCSRCQILQPHRQLIKQGVVHSQSIVGLAGGGGGKLMKIRHCFWIVAQQNHCWKKTNIQSDLNLFVYLDRYTQTDICSIRGQCEWMDTMHAETLAEEVKANRANKQIVTKCFLQIIDCVTKHKAEWKMVEGCRSVGPPGGPSGSGTSSWQEMLIRPLAPPERSLSLIREEEVWADADMLMIWWYAGDI